MFRSQPKEVSHFVSTFLSPFKAYVLKPRSSYKPEPITVDGRGGGGTGSLPASRIQAPLVLIDTIDSKPTKTNNFIQGIADV